MLILNEKKEVVNGEIDFGKVNAGEYKDLNLFIANDSLNATLFNISIDTGHEHVEVIKAPNILAPKEEAALVLRWKPDLKIEEGLRTKIKIKTQAEYPPPK